ncbi:MAG TPA: TerB family tellurite resistance protein [Syntrophales bacterium]|nr:TerB family tellurite resistance protein [Syntrophales bacterium]HPQ44069.1 TerB family tellurite resistance protein [Syntrophales bacterium]
MIDLVKKFFGKMTENGTEEKEDSVHDIRIATCALLLEMAQIDGEFDESEKESILTIIKREYGVDDDHIDAIFETADKELKGSLDLWQFTNLINQNYTQEEKIGIIEMIWRIAYTDGRLDRHEDLLVHKLANLLRLTHRQLIDAKVKVRRLMGIASGDR